MLNFFMKIKIGLSIAAFWVLLYLGCNKSSVPNPIPCDIQNKGISIGTDVKEQFYIDSVVQQSNVLAVWFSDASNTQHYKATLESYGNQKLVSGLCYIMNDYPTFTEGYKYPLVKFNIIDFTSSSSVPVFYIYDQYEACLEISQDNKFGINIEGIKIHDNRPDKQTHSFMTFSTRDVLIRN
jgi:hypothetical protein